MTAESYLLFIKPNHTYANEVESAEPGEHQKAILEILFNDLTEWLFRHMLDEDLKMTEYFNLEKNHRVEDNSEE